jgi:hypothetical protein
MALSDKNLEALNRAKERVAESAIILDRTYWESEFTFKFLPVLTMPALEVISKIQKFVGDDVISQSSNVKDLLLLLALDAETAELIEALIEQGTLDINSMIALQADVVSAAAARPTVRSSSSPDGSLPSGPASTASAQPEESTPQP